MTRREFIGAGMGAAASAAIGRPIRSTLGSMARFEKGTRLPYDAEVEWLRINSTYYSSVLSSPYIDLRFLAGENVGARAKYSIDIGSRAIMIYGSFIRNATGYWGEYAYAGSIYKMWGGATRIKNYPIASVMESYFNYKNSRIYEAYTSGNELFSVGLAETPIFSDSNSILLFACNRGGYFQYEIGPITIYSFELTIDDLVVCNLTPVRFTNEYGEAEGAMYDSVTESLYRNQGTGSFIIGPDI